MIPESNKTLVVLDIDGTLLDENYQVNDLGLPDLISKLQKSGISFCVNSNRSLHDLLLVAQRFNIEGPLIGENGVFIYNSETDSSTYLLKQRQLELVSEQKEKAEKIILEQLSVLFPNKKIYWENVDTVDRISSHSTGKYRNGSIVVLNNKYRQYSVSAHLKYYRDGEFISMKDKIEKVVEAVRTATKEESDIEVNHSPLFANILVSTKLASKRAALELLRDKGNRLEDIYVIGDEIGDFEMINGLGAFLTTANSDDSVKAKAKYYADSNYSKGVSELLLKIAV